MEPLEDIKEGIDLVTDFCFRKITLETVHSTGEKENRLQAQSPVGKLLTRDNHANT